MSKLGWFLAGLFLASPLWSGTAVPVATVTNFNQLFADIVLPGGIRGELTLTFDDPSGLDGTALDVTAERVDPEDAGLNARLPADVFIPSDFPVLIKIEPASGSAFTFSGRVLIEIVAENLDFEANTPLRLFRARSGVGSFQEVTQSIGTGSYRALAIGGGFSEFLIASDLRPLDRVIRKKLARLETLLGDNAGVIDDPVETELDELRDAAEAAFEAGDISEAISNIKDLIEAAEDNSGTGIPDEWDPVSLVESVAGQIRALGASIRHSLVQRRRREPVTTGTLETEVVVDATHSFEATLSFNDSFDIDLEDFELTGELVDPKDPALLARLPAGVSIPSQFPVLVRLNPGSSAGEQAFRGEWALEIETENLEFVADSPLRLFKAPDGGAFEDVTRSLGLGSYRALAIGGGFSEFLIVSDLRPVDDVIEEKFDAIEALLTAFTGSIESSVLAELAGELAQARGDYEAGELDDAIEGVETFEETVDDNSEEDIPALWRSDGSRTNVAGLLTGAARSLEFSLSLKRTPLAADPADVNRDGLVDVQDVLYLINLVFGDPERAPSQPSP